MPTFDPMDKLTKRDFLKVAPVLGAAAATSALAGDGEETSAGDVGSFQADLVDGNFESASGRQFGSQIIHHGEQAGFQVTPISQDKCAPGYQRPGNLRNPTVGTLLKKVMGMEGAEAAIGGPCGMIADFKQAIEKCG